ncbi:LysR family transcriptional regulator [Thalassotalea mangrovi]|uniref:LysR family transcriptional regulator n=1 Tax=Thalassotalea mangrovi TaxID=2572245 RepID=A0A4U1B5U4_9GAMM|nr:LysR family transcriptional regulator [Thalassotalea mangrovi]TKB45501.1 LysR family transcriptional regulator [Thalassotalea mangrovi]
MLKVTLEQWRMFWAVAEYGGFNQAANAIHKSQSSIHHAVHKLEESLGVKLLQTKGRKTVLTDAGELMLRRANFLLDEAGKVEAVAQSLSDGIESRLRIAVDEIFPQELLYQVLDETSKHFPLLRIELQESVLTGASELLEKSEVDIAISPYPLKEGFSEELCQIEFVAVANPEHPLHSLKAPLTLQDLKTHRQIVVRDSAISAQKDVGWLGANQRWTVSHMRTSIDMISSGLGFAWLPLPAIVAELDSGNLKPLPLQQERRRSALLYLMFNDADRLGPAARHFIGELRYQTMNMPTSEQIIDD